MSRVGDQLKRNSGAITTVNSRVNSVNASEKKDNEERKKDLKGIGEKIQLLAMLPLLVKPAGVSLGGGATLLDAQGIAIANPKVLTPTTDTLTALLPLLLLGGFGGSGGLGSSSDGGMDSTTMLVLALALSGALH